MSTFYSKLQELCIALYSSLSVPFRKDHEKAEFEVHEVYAVDVLVSSGEGKVRSVDWSWQRGLAEGVFPEHQTKM